jgi:hypothetical protein
MSLVAAVLLGSAIVVAQQTGLDLDGHAVNPFKADSGKLTVLIFIRRDCPVSSRYAPEIQRISKQYAGSASFWLVYPDKSDSPQLIRKYLADYGYHLPALRDPQHALARLSRVEITPEAAVFDREHRLIYDGRIDDWYLDLGRARAAPTTHELQDAIQTVLAGKTLRETGAKSEVRGVGCYISDLD